MTTRFGGKAPDHRRGASARRALAGEATAAITPTAEDPNPASVLSRVFRLLDSFAGDANQLTLTELMRATGMPKTTVYRLANDLVRRDVLERVPGGYRLGLRLFELGELAPRLRTLREAAAPVMQELFESTRSMVRLSVPDGADVLFIATLGTHGSSVPSKQIYPRAPAHATASGKAMLAFGEADSARKIISGELRRCTPYTITVGRVLLDELRDIRERGVAVEREEARLGLAAVAAPIMSSQGVVGALSIAGRVGCFDPQRRGTTLRAAAGRIGSTLVNKGDPTEDLEDALAR